VVHLRTDDEAVVAEALSTYEPLGWRFAFTSHAREGLGYGGGDRGYVFKSSVTLVNVEVSRQCRCFVMPRSSYTSELLHDLSARGRAGPDAVVIDVDVEAPAMRFKASTEISTTPY
jgi:hypothetical protein